MRKQILLLTVVAALAGCQQNQNPHLRKTDLKILAPTGAPAVAMYNFANGLTTVTDPQNELIPQFNIGEYDIIVAPAKGGLTKIVRQGVSYKMAAVVTFGNFALVKVNENDEVLSAGDKVLFFQENDIPGLVFKYLYNDLGLQTYTVASANMTLSAMNTGVYKPDESTTVNLDYVFSAEPMITNAGKAGKIVERASEAFERKSEGKRIIQAAVFVNTNTSTSKIDNFLDLLESDITKGLENPKNFTKTMNLVGEPEEQMQLFGFNSTVVYNCMKDYNGLGLGFIRASEHKEEIEYFVNDILNSGLTISNEAYY